MSKVVVVIEDIADVIFVNLKINVDEDHLSETEFSGDYWSFTIGQYDPLFRGI